MSNEIVTKDFNKLYQSIRMILIESRKNTYVAINSSMILHIGQLANKL